MTVLSDFKGINNIASVNRMPNGYLTECVNLNINNSGILGQRSGFSEKLAGEFSAIWSDSLRCFAVKNGDLIEIGKDYGETVLRSNIGRVATDFVCCDGNYYYCSPSIHGVIKETTLQSLIGQAMVETQPTITYTSGGTLLAGKYMIAVTTLNDSGEESGTTTPVVFELLEDDKALVLSLLPPTTENYYAIYASTRNGTELFRQGVISTATPSVTLLDIDDGGFPLDSIGIMPAPYGELIAYHYGHLFIARDNLLFYSKPMQYGRWSEEDYYEYPSKITAILPCESGMWISTEESGTYWISGKTPMHGMEVQSDFVQNKKTNSCILMGSKQRIEPDYLKMMTWGWIATAKDGVLLLMDGGQFSNATWDNIRLPEFESCAGAIIEHNESINYLSIIKGALVPERSI
jgi:hypothetical protein